MVQDLVELNGIEWSHSCCKCRILIQQNINHKTRPILFLIIKVRRPRLVPIYDTVTYY